MKLIHIVAGLLALVAGAVALFATKGSTLHRRSGMVFVVAMLVMSSTGALMGAFVKPNPVNVLAGSMTFYLVSTALLTMRRTVEQARGLLTGLMLAALTLSAYAFWLGFQALASADGKVGGITPEPIFMFAVIGLIGGLLDARMLWAGGIQGAHRLARHLWRMGFALWVATTSFFLGQADVFPQFLRENIGLRALPVLLVTSVILFWLARVLVKRQRAVAPPPRPLGNR
jgi:uncharacterized membrane protein